MIGAYRLLDRVGQGGMGEVWRAEHDVLGRPAAIKLIRAGADGDPSASTEMIVRGRFEREARAIASLESPHTVKLYDFGLTPDGDLYYAMELLHGLDLDQFASRFGPMKPVRAAFVFRQVCLSLAEAHARGILHRDIKPSNVFLSRAGLEFDFVKVLDFGLAKLTDPQAGTLSLTREGEVKGTPAFLPPEVLRGKHPGATADVYQLGCLLYWLLTAERVFDASNVAEVCHKHLHEEPLPPSALAESKVPEGLDELTLKMLAKDPAERPVDAASVLDLLRRVECGPPWDGLLARDWWRLHMGDGASVRKGGS